MKMLLILINFCLFAAFSACDKKVETSGDLASSDPDVVKSIDKLSSPFYVDINIAPETTNGSAGIRSTFDSCVIKKGTAVGTNLDCKIRIPEEQLYISELDFKVVTNSSNFCNAVHFQPYYYLRSTSATYKDISGTTVDCSTTPISKACYGGAAPDIVTDFPLNAGYYFLPTFELSHTYTLHSSNSRRLTDRDGSMYFSNVNATNNLVDRASAKSMSGNATYAGGSSFVDYSFSCTDKWANTIYKITLIIADDDEEDTESVSGSKDVYYDWGD